MIEIIHSQESHPVYVRHRIASAIVFIAVMVAGLWQIASAMGMIERMDIPRTWLDFTEGRTTGGLEKQLDQKLPARKNLIAFANGLRYATTGGAGEQVRAGKGDWLFMTDELRFYPDGGKNLSDRMSLLGHFARKLDVLGVKLVVALVPDKARVYEDRLSNGRYPAVNRSRYADALAALSDQGVAVVDLLSPLGRGATQGDVYYHSDTHWNQSGALIAAQAVAASVRPVILDSERITFVTKQEGDSVTRSGDLIRLMGLEEVPRPFRPVGDKEAVAITTQSSRDSSMALFGDTEVPVVLTGTSYSLRGNFHGYLQQALSVKVLNAAKDGGGFLQAATAYLTDDAFRTSRPKVLVWEIPERFLSINLEGEQKWLTSIGLGD